MNKKIFIFLFLVVGTTTLVASPLKLSVDSAVELAIEQNYDLKSSYLDLMMAEDQNDNSWNVMLPDLSLKGTLNDSLSLYDITDSNALSFTGSFASSVTLNKSSRYSMEYDKLSYESESLSYQIDEADLKVGVKRAYYYLVANKRSLEIKKMNLDLALKRWEQMKNSYDNGLVSQLDVLESQSTYENLKPTYTSSNNSYQTKLMSFKSLLGIDLNQEVELVGNLDVEILDLDENVLISTFLNKRLDVELATLNIDSNKNLLDIKKASNKSPSLSLSLDYAISNSNVLDGNWDDNLSMKATLTFPINGYIDGSKEDIAISDAEKRVEQAKLQYKSTIEDAQMEIKTLVLELQGYKESIEICNTAIDISQKTYDANEEAYNLGTTELLNVEEAQATLFSAKQDLLTSQYNYLSALLDLEEALNSNTDQIKSI